MKWCHQVDKKWLAARKGYLTASDVRKLIPVTATGRPRANMDEAVMKVWADKQCEITEDDVFSNGAMARGHLLEPFAIDDFNKQEIVTPLFHWDDTLIHSPDGVSCSPDALSIIQPTDCPVVLASADPKVVAEVKCYAGPAHYVAGMGAPKLTLEERWQIATAMYVMPSIEQGVLIFYNPNAEHPLFYKLYTRLELKDELELIKQVNESYQAAALNLDSISEVRCPASMKALCTLEYEIIDELIEKADIDNGLNP